MSTSKSIAKSISNFLPREHGATVIWFSSTILALISSCEINDYTRLILFLFASISILKIVAVIGRSNTALIQAERNPVFLLILSGILTLILPFGNFFISNSFSMNVFPIWLLLLIYTLINVVYIRINVRRILFNEPKPLFSLMVLSLISFSFSDIFLILIYWVNQVAVLSIPLLIATFILVAIVCRRPTELKLVKVKRIGIIQFVNMLLLIIILSASSIC